MTCIFFKENVLDSYYKESKITHAQQIRFIDLWRDETLRGSFILVCLIVFGTTLTVSTILARYEMILLLEFGFTQEGVGSHFWHYTCSILLGPILSIYS